MLDDFGDPSLCHLIRECTMPLRTLSDRILVSKHCTWKPREILKDRATTWIHVLSPTILRKSLGLSKHYVPTSNITASRGKVQLAFRRNDAMGLLAPSRQYEKTGGHSPRFAMVWIYFSPSRIEKLRTSTLFLRPGLFGHPDCQDILNIIKLKNSKTGWWFQHVSTTVL